MPKRRMSKQVAAFFNNQAVEGEPSDNEAEEEHFAQMKQKRGKQHAITAGIPQTVTTSVDTRNERATTPPISSNAKNATTSGVPSIVSDDIVFVDGKIKGSVFRKGINVSYSDGELKSFHLALWQYIRSDALGLPDDKFKQLLNNQKAFSDTVEAINYTLWNKGGLCLSESEFQKFMVRVDKIETLVANQKQELTGDISE